MAIRAGQIVRALDYAGYAGVWDGSNVVGFNSTTYIPGTPVVGVTFVAPTSGAVLLTWGARLRLDSATAVTVLASVETRTGGTIGSGTVVQSASDDAALETGEATLSRIAASMSRDVTGLTPGATYNTRVVHRNQVSVASAATIFGRSLYVVPLHV